MTVEIRISTREFAAWLRRATEDFQAGAKQALGQSVALALREARATQAFKDRTGELRRSIVSFRRSDWAAGIKATAKHAAYVEYGTEPHRIEARKARSLRFVSAGEIRFRRSVQHPGTKPTHFMERAGDAGRTALEEMLLRAIARAFR